LFRYFLCLVGLIFILPILGIILFAFTFAGPITISGIGYLLGSLLTACGLFLAPRISKYYVAILAGILGVVLVVCLRLFFIRLKADAGLQILALPEAKPTAWINTLIDEQDTLIFGEALFHQIGGDSIMEHKGLTSALAADYDQMQKVGIFASPVLSTYLNMEQSGHFDAVIIKPDTNGPPKFGLVFLHGFMGNVTAQCWEIAQAARPLGGLTVCPSTEWRGEWWQPDGQEILKSTFAYLKGLDIQKFYLGGFSNGGFSIGHLAPNLGSEQGLGGLIFIDGIYDGPSIKGTGLPVLVIEGLQDERAPAAAVRPIVEQIGESATYVEMEGDHFLIMKHPAAIQSAITNWLEQFEGRQNEPEEFP
jgi:pimeloyl-ACP methyl ester carboxylesterase